MKYILTSLLSFGVWLVILLALDLHTSMLMVFAKSILLSAITVGIWVIINKPAKRWYIRNFSKTYKYSRQKPIAKDKIRVSEKV
jgi:hypothetical protein